MRRFRRREDEHILESWNVNLAEAKATYRRKTIFKDQFVIKISLTRKALNARTLICVSGEPLKIFEHRCDIIRALLRTYTPSGG